MLCWQPTGKFLEPVFKNFTGPSIARETQILSPPPLVKKHFFAGVGPSLGRWKRKKGGGWLSVIPLRIMFEHLCRSQKRKAPSRSCQLPCGRVHTLLNVHGDPLRDFVGESCQGGPRPCPLVGVPPPQQSDSECPPPWKIMSWDGLYLGENHSEDFPERLLHGR